jgi:dihydroorotate dehydrogenase
MGPSTRLLRQFHQASAGRLILIGVGGIACGADAYAKIRAGANAVQLYTSLIYQGPGIVTRICRDLTARLKADGFTSIDSAVGAQ